ncbi:MAG TPA: XdhC family protein [Candidatus Tumulicola sp.]|nr:XdhC family protein [Candidatus Tumulicola sp.]
MRDAFRRIAAHLREERPFAVATLVAVRNASPAPIGTSLVVESDGSFFGNVGAGCHEGELVEAARAALRDGRSRSLTFGLTDELLDGSACGASLTAVVWVPGAEFGTLAAQIADGRSEVTFDCAGYAVAIPAKRGVIIVGATELAGRLARAARDADFRVVVIDPRPAFATRERLPDADEMIEEWPQDVLPGLLGYTDAIVVLAHDVKIDLPALRCALDSRVSYIGVLGSRRSQNARRESLAALGYDEMALARIRGPVGLDLGAVTNAQIACSILAEILSVLNDRSGRPLVETAGAITE